MSRRVPDGSNPVAMALYKAGSCEQVILTTGGGNPVVACEAAAAACLAVASRLENSEKPRWRIRPGKPQPNTEQAETVAGKWKAAAADYERLSDLRAQAETLATELTRRVRNLMIENARAKLYADREAVHEWREDHAFINGVHVGSRAKTHGVKCLALWDTDADAICWRRETPDAPAMFSPDGVIADLFSREALSPMPSDAEV